MSKKFKRQKDCAKLGPSKIWSKYDHKSKLSNKTPSLQLIFYMLKGINMLIYLHKCFDSWIYPQNKYVKVCMFIEGKQNLSS